MRKNLLGLELHTYPRKIVLEKIKKYIQDPTKFYHIVSINPENVVLTRKNPMFKKIVNTAQIQIVDGFGAVLAGKILSLGLAPRLTGVDLMQELLEMAGEGRLAVMLVGGRGNLAKQLASCYSKHFPEAKYVGVEGVKNIVRPTKSEENKIFAIVSDIKPRILLVAFGSPWQELWLRRNRHKLKGIVCMGVGGGFDYLSGRVSRAPFIVRKLGLEWLYRLLRQPWRLRRQLKLIEFIYLVIKQRITGD